MESRLENDAQRSTRVADGSADDAVTALRRRLRERPADRFPIDHATTRYHLGVALAARDDLDGAEESLVEAAHLFEGRLPAEWAKVLNALGAILRARGRPGAAEDAFGHAARVFGEQGLALDEAAAWFNLGLVTLDQGAVETARQWFEQAAGGFPADTAPLQRSAALREQGGAVLVLGRAEEALPLLQEARRLAETEPHPDTVAAASNVAGIALLELDRVDDARSSFAAAVANAPPGTRPEMQAMARANLALAYQLAGDRHRARLLARQVLTMPAAVAAVVDQAHEIIARVGDRPGGFVRLLLETPDEERIPLTRAEMARWLRLDDRRRTREVGAWIDEQPSDRTSRASIAEPWLATLLELPPSDLTALADAVDTALRDRPAEDAEAFRTGVSAAMIRFHEPQWRRLRVAFRFEDADAEGVRPWT